MNKILPGAEYVKTLDAWFELYVPALPREVEVWSRDLLQAFRALPYLDALRCERSDRPCEPLRLRGSVALRANNGESVEADVLSIWRRDLMVGLNGMGAIERTPDELGFRFAARNWGDRFVAVRMTLAWKR